MTAEQAAAEYYDAWRSRGGDMSDVPLADDFRFLGPVASFDTAEGYRAMARQAGEAVRAFEVGRQFVDGDTVCSIVDWEVPPEAAEYVGPQAIGRFLSTVPAAGSLERFRLVPTRANGQPAFGCYLKDPHTPIAHAYGLMVLTLRGDRVAGLAGFADTAVFAAFGLPRTLKA